MWGDDCVKLIKMADLPSLSLPFPSLSSLVSFWTGSPVAQADPDLAG